MAIMTNQPTANNEVARWDNGDETHINQNTLIFIKNPITPPETKAEEL
jgi:hypothetical protein